MSIDSQNLPKISHYLGIDFGTSKIGLALADTETKIAYAHKTLNNDKDLLQKILEIIAQENVLKVIIGIPAYINKKEVIYVGERLGKIINKAAGVEVEYQDEMFTTKMAQANLIEKGVKGVKKYDDQEAARIILQSWLDSQKSKY